MRKAALYGLAVVCVCLLFAMSGPSAQRVERRGPSNGTVTNGTAGFAGVTTGTFSVGIGALVASRACSATYPQSRLCEWSDIFRSIPPPTLDTDVLVAQNYEVNPVTTCLTPDGGLKCKPGELVPAACCGVAATAPVALLTLSASSQDLTSCSDRPEFVATALTQAGDPVGGVLITFELVPEGDGSVTGSFQPGSGVTDQLGEVRATFDLDQTSCNSRCVGSSDCGTLVRVRDQQGAIVSNEIHLNDQIP
jgi:hypothetical protein